MQPINIFTESYKSVVKVESTPKKLSDIKLPEPTPKKKTEVASAVETLKTVKEEMVKDSVAIPTKEDSGEARESDVLKAKVNECEMPKKANEAIKTEPYQTDMSYRKNGKMTTECGDETYDSAGRMSRQNLWKIGKNSEKLFSLLKDDDALEPWFQEKIAVAAEMIDTVTHYMEYEIEASAGGAEEAEGAEKPEALPNDAVITVTSEKKDKLAEVVKEEEKTEPKEKTEKSATPSMHIEYQLTDKKHNHKKVHSGIYPSIEALYAELKAEKKVSPNAVHIVSVHSATLTEAMRKV